jgi:hypothetical protein
MRRRIIMVLDNEFIEAVNGRNNRLVRIKLGNIITIDPTLKTFREMQDYAERHLDNLYDVHQGELNTDKSCWTKDYYIEQQAELSFNFSRERLGLLCNMAVHLYGARINTINESRTRENRDDTAKYVGGGALAGGVIVAGIGAAVKAPIVIGIGIAAAVIGAVILIKDSFDS